MTNIFEHYAGKYWDMGYSAIPIAPGKKAPLIGDWSKWCRNIPDEREQEALVHKYPTWGIGICAGPASNLVWLDVDAPADKYPEVAHIVRSIIPTGSVEKYGRMISLNLARNPHIGEPLITTSNTGDTVHSGDSAINTRLSFAWFWSSSCRLESS